MKSQLMIIGRTESDLRNDRKEKGMEQSIVVYESDANLRLQVKTNMFKEGKIEGKVVYAKFAYTTQHDAMACKTQVKVADLYNLAYSLVVPRPIMEAA